VSCTLPKARTTATLPADGTNVLLLIATLTSQSALSTRIPCSFPWWMTLNIRLDGLAAFSGVSKPGARYYEKRLKTTTTPRQFPTTVLCWSAHNMEYNENLNGRREYVPAPKSPPEALQLTGSLGSLSSAGATSIYPSKKELSRTRSHPTIKDLSHMLATMPSSIRGGDPKANSSMWCRLLCWLTS
jgi:hypothetical protein